LAGWGGLILSKRALIFWKKKQQKNGYLLGVVDSTSAERHTRPTGALGKGVDGPVKPGCEVEGTQERRNDVFAWLAALFAPQPSANRKFFASFFQKRSACLRFPVSA
jgi:hypothetical protein